MVTGLVVATLVAAFLVIAGGGALAVYRLWTTTHRPDADA